MFHAVLLLGGSWEGRSMAVCDSFIYTNEECGDAPRWWWGAEPRSHCCGGRTEKGGAGELKGG